MPRTARPSADREIRGSLCASRTLIPAPPANSRMPIPITLIPGDGIGPDITDATVRILEAAGADIAWDRKLAGMAAVAAHGDPMPDETLASISRTNLALKGPLETPVGSGYRSVNVALRKEFDLYANVRPARSDHAGSAPVRQRRPRARAREHRGPLRRRRALHQDRRRSPRRRRVGRDHHALRVRAHPPLRVRVRREARTHAKSRSCTRRTS